MQIGDFVLLANGDRVEVLGFERVRVPAKPLRKRTGIIGGLRAWATDKRVVMVRVRPPSTRTYIDGTPDHLVVSESQIVAVFAPEPPCVN